MLNEADIIQKLQAAFSSSSSGIVGIGDDAAVLPISDAESYVISKDILVENRHFRLRYSDPASLAHKALHVNLSDIAAMGAKPCFVMLGVALPPTLASEWIETFFVSFTEACKKQNVQLIGGDTTASERDLFISVTVIGRAENAHLKFRHGAKVGDVVCIAGDLGESHAGLVALEKNEAGMDIVKAKSLRPVARKREGLWIGEQTDVTAMMDVSDGFYVDLERLLKASKVGAIVNLELLKPSKKLAEACATLHLDVRECMLIGGEDYALLLTISAGAYEKLDRDFEKEFGYPLIKVGAITATDGLELRENGKPVPFTCKPFSHFGEL